LPAPEQIARAIDRLRQAILDEVAAMPCHRAFLAANAGRLAATP
jgi:hypothetical protein